MKIDASHLQLTIILDFLQHDEFIFIMIMSLHSRETALILCTLIGLFLFLQTLSNPVAVPSALWLHAGQIPNNI